MVRTSPSSPKVQLGSWKKIRRTSSQGQKADFFSEKRMTAEKHLLLKGVRRQPHHFKADTVQLKDLRAPQMTSKPASHPQACHCRGRGAHSSKVRLTVTAESRGSQSQSQGRTLNPPPANLCRHAGSLNCRQHCRTAGLPFSSHCHSESTFQK